MHRPTVNQTVLSFSAPPGVALTRALVVALAFTLAGCGDKPPAAAPAAPDPVVQGQQLRFPAGHPQLALLGIVAAAPAGELTLELPARLVWNEDRTQRLYAPFAGRVERIAVDVGQAVAAGTVLAQLASPEFGVAQADTAKAQADAQLTQRTLARQRELFEAGVIARKDLELAEADAARALAETQRAQARTRLYGGGVGVDQRLALSAGIAGVVVERNLNPGQELRPDQSGAGVPPLFTLSDPASLWVLIDAREGEAAALKPGTVLDLAVPALPGQMFEARITAAGDFIDPTTRRLRVRGVVANPSRLLKAEMLATARAKLRLPAGAVVVPAAAIKLEGSGHTVMVAVAPGTFEQRKVDVGHQSQGEAYVTQGLAVGDKVVAQNMLLLSRQYRLALDDHQGQGADKAARAASAAPAASGSTR